MPVGSQLQPGEGPDKKTDHMAHIPGMLEGTDRSIIKPGIEMKKKQDSGDQKQCIKFEAGMHVRRISVGVEKNVKPAGYERLAPGIFQV